MYLVPRNPGDRGGVSHACAGERIQAGKPHSRNGGEAGDTHMVMIVLSHFLPHVTVEKFQKS